jgi:hypothetical protein
MTYPPEMISPFRVNAASGIDALGDPACRAWSLAFEIDMQAAFRGANSEGAIHRSLD